MADFNWKALSDEEIVELKNNHVPGRHKAIVTDVEIRRSEAGNPMANMTFKLLTEEGDKKFFDSLIFIDKMAWKTKAFWNSAKKPEIYEKGSCSRQDFIGCTVDIETQLEKSKDGKSLYIRVAEYLYDEDFPATQNLDAPSNVEGLTVGDIALDDDIPF